MHTIIGIFNTARDAQRATEMLQDSNLKLDDVSLVSRTTEGVSVDDPDDVSASQGAGVGAVWGGVVGLASLAIPGVGPIIAGGALATAVATALTGAVTGAIVGGIAAGLINFGGISEDEARQYESLVHAGKSLVAVKASDEAVRHVHRILTKAGAETVQGDTAAAAPTPVQVAAYDEHGKRVNFEGDDLSSSSSHTP